MFTTSILLYQNLRKSFQKKFKIRGIWIVLLLSNHDSLDMYMKHILYIFMNINQGNFRCCSFVPLFNSFPDGLCLLIFQKGSKLEILPMFVPYETLSVFIDYSVVSSKYNVAKQMKLLQGKYCYYYRDLLFLKGSNGIGYFLSFSTG